MFRRSVAGNQNEGNVEHDEHDALDDEGSTDDEYKNEVGWRLGDGEMLNSGSGKSPALVLLGLPHLDMSGEWRTDGRLFWFSARFGFGRSASGIRLATGR